MMMILRYTLESIPESKMFETLENPCPKLTLAFNCFLVGAVELPSYLIGCLAMDRVGRKMTCAPALLLGGIACMLIIAVPQVQVVVLFFQLLKTQ